MMTNNSSGNWSRDKTDAANKWPHDKTGDVAKIMTEPPKPGRGGLLQDEIMLEPEEIRLLKFLRQLSWGEATVKVKNSKPVMASRAVQELKLD